SPPFYGVFNSSRPFADSSAEGRLKLLFSFERTELSIKMLLLLRLLVARQHEAQTGKCCMM
ncbi:hypothetical protein P4626_03005, partial [Halalkalibacterium halodurans]|uniref:hypothetical protein n=1 Tax=Halalkalibacterium halodurans TaxID=86665 RepID=UPI002E1F1F45|nr:hypothetical protein [Halalkalibacterium halodurans]